MNESIMYELFVHTYLSIRKHTLVMIMNCFNQDFEVVSNIQISQYLNIVVYLLIDRIIGSIQLFSIENILPFILTLQIINLHI